MLETFVSNLDSYNIVNCNANVIFITASMPGRNPNGAVVDSFIDSLKIVALNAKILAYNASKSATLVRVTSYSVGGCDINAK